MVTVDHNKNIQRIIDRIRSDPDLFDNGETAGLLRSVQFGDPPERVSGHFPMPYSYVTTASDLQETSPQTGVTNPDNVKSVTAEYRIVIVAQAKARQIDSQRQIYNLIRDMRKMTESDPLFTDPESQGNDPIFVRSIISDVRWDEQTRGKLVTVITMTLLATIGALFFLEVPGIGSPIPLISKPVDRDSDSVEDILDDTLILRTEAVTKSKRSVFAEFETSPSILTAFRDIKSGREPGSFTIQRPSGDETVDAFVVNIESSQGFSDMETTVVQLDLINP
jgi:hypothetical protein